MKQNLPNNASNPIDSTIESNSAGACRSAPTCSPSLDWNPISETPAKNFGWYAAALLPFNHAVLSPSSINSWREKFGFTTVWYNASSSVKWWVADFHGSGASPVFDRITHWAELPSVPLILDNDHVLPHPTPTTTPQNPMSDTQESNPPQKDVGYDGHLTIERIGAAYDEIACHLTNRAQEAIQKVRDIMAMPVGNYPLMYCRICGELRGNGHSCDWQNAEASHGAKE